MAENTRNAIENASRIMRTAVEELERELSSPASTSASGQTNVNNNVNSIQGTSSTARNYNATTTGTNAYEDFRYCL